jgi:CsoR family transcriptional regulator, copper-sensing transcriptional repressor
MDSYPLGVLYSLRHMQVITNNRNQGPAPRRAKLRMPHHAVAVDASVRSNNLKRLKRIEGQVRGVQRMVEQDRYCADIMVQIAAINEALRAVARQLLHNHLRHCATEAIRSGSSKRAEEMYAELSDLFAKFAR